eukprot:TRINITY_DN1433_c0_g1_i1.p2 TRINITY_DN1433_c0_g1~~TRINITY_DN1433_c0_g1_i1.p2  ORF type:complete len:227 (+),score=41.07 TRINITY_DN1433_c0_g1_i1:863-1543(+)
MARRVMNYSWPEGWGQDPKRDLDAIKMDATVAKHIECVCSKCADYLAQSGWPAYPDGCYAVDVRDVPPAIAPPTSSMHDTCNARFAYDPSDWSCCDGCMNRRLDGLDELPFMRERQLGHCCDCSGYLDCMAMGESSDGAPTCGQVAQAYADNGCCGQPRKVFSMGRRLLSPAVADGNAEELMAAVKQNLGQLKKKLRQLHFKKDKLGAQRLTSSLKGLLHNFLTEQ